MDGGGVKDAIRQIRAEGLLSEATWDEVGNLGVVDVIFAPSLDSGLVTAVVLLLHRSTIHTWPLAERPDLDSARAAARFLLDGLAGLRRLTRERHPWARGAGEDQEPEHATARHEAVENAVGDWQKRVEELVFDAKLARTAADDAAERRRRAVAGAPIREARKRWGVTQAQLADRAGLKAALLSQIERGLVVPDGDTRARIAAALDAHEDQLFAGFSDL